ncbi:MAG: DedA family protein, partial [Chlamydiota bacterium]
MDSLINLLFAHAACAHWILFFSLLLTGFSIPISEDLLVILSAILASTVIPEHFILLFIFVFFGCYFSDMIAYWIGRLTGCKLGKFRWFYRFSNKKLSRIESFYKKYGFYALLLGRWIPFGVRNCLFLVAGMGKMSFKKFLLGDGIACLLTNALLFYLTYTLGKNYQILYSHLKTVNIFLGVFVLIVILCLIWYYKRKAKGLFSSEASQSD